jgi:hypothetical protein
VAVLEDTATALGIEIEALFARPRPSGKVSEPLLSGRNQRKVDEPRMRAVPHPTRRSTAFQGR